MSKESEKQKGKAYPGPNQAGADHFKRHVEGNIGVHGQIEIHDPPELKGEKDTRYQNEQTYKKNDRILSVATLVAVSIYTVLTFWQGCLTRQSVDNSTRQFQIEQRPYLWDTEVRPTISMKVDERMWASITIINYGKSPALRARITGKIFVGESARHDADQWFGQFGDKPFTDTEDSETVIPPGIPSPVSRPEKLVDYKSGEPYRESQTFGGGGLFTIKTDQPLKQSDIDEIFHTDYFAVFVMRWQCYDGFGNFYWTNICMASIANGNTINCPHHDEIR